GGRHRLCRGQQHGRSGAAPALEADRGGYAQWRGELPGAGCDLCRRAANLRSGARDRRETCIHQKVFHAESVMSEKPDLDHLRQWIGRSTEASDTVTAQLVKGLRATLFLPVGEPQAGDAAPFTVHGCLAPPVVPASELGPDGHPARGGFLPPVPLPRRMWAGGELEFIDTLRVGDEVTRTSRIKDVSLKSGSTGTLCF